MPVLIFVRPNIKELKVEIHGIKYANEDTVFSCFIYVCFVSG